MFQRLTKRLSGRRRANDEGFSLIELVIAMAIIGGVLLALVTLQTKAMVTIAQAKERQQATAVANRVLEEMRALPWRVISNGGLPGSIPADDPFVTSDSLTIPGEEINGEPLVLFANHEGALEQIFRNSPLHGAGGSNVTKHFDGAQGREFIARSYVTSPEGRNAPLNIIVSVEWTLNSSSEKRSVVAQSTVFNTKSGCGSDDNRPYVAACQDFYYANADGNTPKLTITGVEADEDEDGPGAADLAPPILYGSNISRITLAGSSVGTSIDSAQASSIKSSANPGSFTVLNLNAEEVSTSSDNSVFAEASNAVGSSKEENDSDSVPAAYIINESYGGSNSSLKVQSSRRGADATASTTQLCGSWTTNGSHCGVSAASISGSDSLTLELGGHSIELLRINAGIEPSVRSGRFPGGIAAPGGLGLCNVSLGSGCVMADSSISGLGIDLPGLAALSVTQHLSASVGTSESSREGKADRTGSYTTYWEGGGSGPIGSSSIRLEPDEAVAVFQDGNIEVSAEPEIVLGAVEYDANVSGECRETRCEVAASITDLSISVKYTIDNGGEKSAFVVSIVGGGASASATFQASPEAYEDD